MRGLLGALALLFVIVSPAHANCAAWPEWETFKTKFVSADGRVIDPMHKDRRTVSEGQAYAMMFALIANDRARFEQFLGWTTNNLARGDMAQHLPAWLWGQRKDESWGVMDPNAATDADVWIAYALLEAARLWSEPRYAALGEKMIANIRRHEVMTVPGLGEVLMPAPFGFVETEHRGHKRWRLNPSYLATQPLRRFRAHTSDPVWDEVLASARRILIEGAPKGFPGDWLLWRPDSGFAPDEKTLGTSSYDSIRVYLWIGMLHPEDPDRAALLAHYAPIRGLLSQEGRPPEFVDIASGRTRGKGLGGFSAALLPFFTARGELGPLLMQKLQLTQLSVDDAQFYYNQVLRLWGMGWEEGRYRFAADGRLLPRWVESCAAP